MTSIKQITKLLVKCADAKADLRLCCYKSLKSQSNCYMSFYHEHLESKNECESAKFDFREI